jgi:hypothetical protein
MTAFYVLFHPSTRYRVPTDPALFLLSAAALVWLAAYVARRRTMRTPPAQPVSASSPHRSIP